MNKLRQRRFKKLGFACARLELALAEPDALDERRERKYLETALPGLGRPTRRFHFSGFSDGGLRAVDFRSIIRPQAIED